MDIRMAALALLATTALGAPTHAATITFSCGYQATEVRLCEDAAAAWSAKSGHEVVVIRGPERSDERYFAYLDLLARGDPGLDVLQIDVIWPSALADELVDLHPAVRDGDLERYLAPIVANNTVEDRLVALPWFTDVGMLYYRKDLLEQHDLEVPQTWGELATSALAIQEAERAAGNPEFWGYVFQGQAYEGLTCNVLEWVAAYGGGEFVDPDGEISLNNPAAALALGDAAAWVGTIAPERVTSFVEEDARITFQRGNAAFMRNWPYAWSVVQAEDSPVRDRVGVAPLPMGGAGGRHAATLGGWNLAVSKHSANPEAAVDFVYYLASEAEQKRRAILGSFAPTIASLYEDPEVVAANPFFADLAPVLEGAVVRPSSRTGDQYAQVSTLIWEAAHRTLSGYGTARANLALLEDRLRFLKRRAGW